MASYLKVLLLVAAFGIGDFFFVVLNDKYGKLRVAYKELFVVSLPPAGTSAWTCKKGIMGADIEDTCDAGVKNCKATISEY